MNKLYDAEFKARVVGIALSGDVTKRQVAHDFGICATTLYRWIDESEGKSKVCVPSGRDLQVENNTLRRRITVLEQENEVMRRAAGFLAIHGLSSKKGFTH